MLGNSISGASSGKPAGCQKPKKKQVEGLKFARKNLDAIFVMLKFIQW
jgi:hypothetical protein